MNIITLEANSDAWLVFEQVARLAYKDERKISLCFDDPGHVQFKIGEGMWSAPMALEARYDSEKSRGKVNAPATDKDGLPCWNVWVTGDQSSPHTFHTHDDAVTFANRKTADGNKVYTDF